MTKEDALSCVRRDWLKRFPYWGERLASLILQACDSTVEGKYLANHFWHLAVEKLLLLNSKGVKVLKGNQTIEDQRRRLEKHYNLVIRQHRRHLQLKIDFARRAFLEAEAEWLFAELET